MNNIRPYLHYQPQIGKQNYIDSTALVIGNVTLASQISIWPGSIIRADVNYIKIGAKTNIQDLSVLHVSKPSTQKPQGSPLIIGEEVTIGHRVILHGCQIGNRVLIGMGSIILDDAIIENEVIIGAGSLVPPRKKLLSGYLYMGSPIKPIRELSTQEKQSLIESAQHYVQLAANHQTTIHTPNHAA